MTRLFSPLAARFRIGEVPVELSTTSRRLLRQYTATYQQWRVDDNAESESLASDSFIRVSVLPEPFRPWRRRRYEVRINDQVLFRPARFQELLPYIEWAITWDVPRALPQFLQLHAATLERNGQGVIFPGASGNGKSTLTAGLIAHGWQYLCDEFALIHSDTLQLHAYPRAICAKESAYPVLQKIGIDAKRTAAPLSGPKGSVCLLNPEHIRKGSSGSICPVRFVIFPKYTAGAMPALIPISRPEAVSMLHTVCFNLLKCRRLGLDVLTEVVREARCYRLISGDLSKTCQLVDALVAGRQNVLAEAS